MAIVSFKPKIPENYHAFCSASLIALNWGNLFQLLKELLLFITKSVIV